jgi:hypothetical protein
VTIYIYVPPPIKTIAPEYMIAIIMIESITPVKLRAMIAAVIPPRKMLLKNGKTKACELYRRVPKT